MHEETAMDYRDVTSEVCAKKEDIHNAGFQGGRERNTGNQGGLCLLYVGVGTRG